MISVTCACGKRLKTEEKYAGRKTKCPNCGETNFFPDGASKAGPELAFPFPADDAGGLEDLLSKAPEPTMPAASLAFDARPRSSPTLHLDPEPSSYRVATGVARLIGYLGVIQFLLVCLAVGVPMVRNAANEAPVGSAIMMLAGSLGAAVSAVLTSAFVGVVVDIARNMRRLRAEQWAK